MAVMEASAPMSDADRMRRSWPGPARRRPAQARTSSASFPNATPKTGVTVTDPYSTNGEKAWLTSPAVAAAAPTGCGGKKPSAGNFTGGSVSGGDTYCDVSGGTGDVPLDVEKREAGVAD